MRLLALGLFLCMTLGACGATDPTEPGDAAPEPGSPPVPHEVTDDRSGTEFAPGAALIMAQTTPFDGYTALPGDRISVHFVTGSPECYGADAVVEETDETVTITLSTGTLESAKDKACIMIAVYGTMTLQLSAPLGDRTVLSGL